MINFNRTKKIISLLIVAIIMTGSLTGCGNSESDNSSAADTTTAITIALEDKPMKGGRTGGMGGTTAVDTSSINTKYLDVAYATTSSSQVLDIYLPNEGEGPFPVIIAVHGGAFKSGDKTGELSYLNAALEAGYAVVSVNYRLSSEAIFPAAINDVKAAIRYIRANATQYSINPEKIALWGGSAGGNLVSLAGTTGGTNDLYDTSLGNADVSDDVTAVVDWFGPIYFSRMDDQFAALGSSPAMGATNSANSPESAYLGKTIGTDEAEPLVKQASPETYITSDDPAFFIQHGTADGNIPITQSEEFSTALAKVLGDDNVTFEKIEGAGHGTSEFTTDENIAKVLAWLDTLMK